MQSAGVENVASRVKLGVGPEMVLKEREAWIFHTSPRSRFLNLHCDSSEPPVCALCSLVCLLVVEVWVRGKPFVSQ